VPTIFDGEHLFEPTPLPGGRTDSSRPPTGYDTRTVTRGVAQLVRHLRPGRVLVVEHDVGAVHACTYAIRHLGEVRAPA
jgi:pimeloyl-ACP methyl ester carboxylesterase